MQCVRFVRESSKLRARMIPLMLYFYNFPFNQVLYIASPPLPFFSTHFSAWWSMHTVRVQKSSHEVISALMRSTRTQTQNLMTIQQWDRGSVRYETSSCMFLPLLEKWYCFKQSYKLFNLVIADVPISVLDRVNIKIKKINYSVSHRIIVRIFKGRLLLKWEF